MDYTKPMCECGAPLFYYEEEVHEITRRITTAGKASSSKLLDVMDGGAYSRLICGRCDAEYGIEYDEQRRLIRGKRWR